MKLPTIFASCEPGQAVLKDTIDFEDFVAVLRCMAFAGCLVVARFFADACPLADLKNRLRNDLLSVQRTNQLLMIKR